MGIWFGSMLRRSPYTHYLNQVSERVFVAQHKKCFLSYSARPKSTSDGTIYGSDTGDCATHITKSEWGQ